MNKKTSRQAQRFHAPLVVGDTDQQTVGCRHTNPDICARNAIPAVCAFARADGICLAPPSTWRKQYLKLKALVGSEE